MKAYYGGYKRFVTELPTEGELPLLKTGMVEAVPICIDGSCEYNDRAAGHVCKYELWKGKEAPDHDCCYTEYYMGIPSKVKYRISITDRGKKFFEEKVPRVERIYVLLEMKAWRWALYEVNKLTAAELAVFFSHRREDVRKAAWARFNTLAVLERIDDITDT